MRVSGYFGSIDWGRQHFLLIVILFIVTGLSLAKVYCTHKLRSYHFQLDKTNKNIAIIKVEYSKFLLEKTTLTADSRVERIARKMGMHVPDKIFIIKP